AAMKCVIGGAHLRVFGRAIHTIARVSDEFWFDPTDKGLALRSVNSSRSAYACVFFSSVFFQHYCGTAASQPCQKEKQLSLPCKLIIKAVLPVFRYVNVLERNVVKCSIYTDPSHHLVTFQLLCKHGVVKTYNLTFQECHPLRAVFAKHMCPNVLKVHSRLLADVVIHFPTSQEEITLAVTPMRVSFRSYTEEDTDFSKVMLTEIQLDPGEFDYFQVGVDSEVTFCLKELRGLLAFSEASNVSISIHFDRSGKPIAFSVEDMVLEASVILATLREVEETASPQAPDKDCDEEAASSKKPQQDRKALNRETVKASSPCAKQEMKGASRATKSLRPGMAGAARAENQQGGEATESCYGKVRESHSLPCVLQFHSLFFGAVSREEEDPASPTFCSLATASDTEEEQGYGQSSPV
ncbi:RAD9B protein, partial [Upupa epops]|nr:RAD9B protein [Upupa epops]